MKKYLILASAAIIALAACNKVPEVAPVSPIGQNDNVVLTFSSERPGLETDTRTEWNTNKVVWSTGDKIRVGYQKDGSWMGQSEPGTAKFYMSDAVSINGGNASVGTFNVPISGSAFVDPSTSGTYQFFAVCPGNAINNATVGNPASQSITLPSSQTPGADTFDPSADILVGQTASLPLSGLPTDPIEINWTRLVAHADLTFSNLAFDGAESVTKITLTFNSEAKVAGSFAVSIPAGTAGEGSTNVLVLNGTNITEDASSAHAWASILPVTFTALTVELKTDKATYTREITGISKTFKQNARNTLTINMSTANRVANTEDIPNGNYVILALTGGNYYAISSNPNGTSQRRDRVQITTNDFDPADYSAQSPYVADNNIIWTVTNVTGGVKINLAIDSNSYMAYGSNTLPLNSTGSIFDVSEGTADGSYNLQSTSYIYLNGTSGFGCYANAQTTKDLYFVPATGTPTLTFPVTSKSVDAEATSVDFAYTSTFLSGAPVVSVTSDTGNAVLNTEIAAGTLTVTLNENTTASEKQVTLTVSAAGVSPVVLTITQAGVVGDANNGDILWAEAFSGFSENDVPATGNGSTTVYGSKSVTYVCVNGKSDTKIYAATLAGGTSPELLVNQSGGSFTVSGIPTGNATGFTLTFKANNGNIAVSSTTPSATIGSNIGSANAPVYGITVPGGTKTLSITFSNSEGNNTRIDDISVVAGAPVPGITVSTLAATATASATGTTATLNGSLTLVNGAVNASVTEAGFYYKLTSAGSYSKVTCAAAPTSTTSFSYDLTGLTKDSEYTYYAYAVYDDGDEVTGSTTTFTPSQTGGGGGKTNQVLFHETFGNNTGNARAWNNSYSDKSGVTAVYSGITGYTISNAKQSKNTMGSTDSGLTQTTAGTDAYIIIGPLDVSSAENMELTYQWKAASIKGTYSTSLYYATSSGGVYTEVSGTGAGATSYVERSYTLPVAAQVSTLYLKIVWNTSNTSALIDEVDLQGDY
ncbi:MAG: hypothetical protein IKR82_04115 [Bacteroidales bacterium]|nr:hypothetical protein [Bacteroidales bacterium]